MPIVVCSGGQLRFLQSIIDIIVMRVGLFRNDHVPVAGDTIAAYTPANFSGYVGTQAILGWGVAVTENRKAIARAVQVQWVHNGGGTNNNIYGIYVVDGTGALLWSERATRSPILVDGAHPFVTYIPVLTDTTEYDPG